MSRADAEKPSETQLLLRHLMTAPYPELTRYWLTIAPTVRKYIGAALEARALTFHLTDDRELEIGFRVAQRVLERLEEQP